MINIEHFDAFIRCYVILKWDTAKGMTSCVHKNTIYFVCFAKKVSTVYLFF